MPHSYTPPEIWSFAPFVLLLLCIAILPLIPATHHWWERNGNKLLVAAVLGFVMLLYYGLIHAVKDPHGAEPGEPGGHLLTGWHAVTLVLKHAVLAEYVPFIVLLFALYTISGGILLRGDIEARPSTNCAFLATGAILASFMGTTGASMLLIRALLKTNSERKYKVHTVVFFIFIVSNIGGSLTPLGDPPLFLGYLMGVPFWWTLKLFVPWLFMNAVLLVVYFIWDSLAYKRETPRAIRADETRIEPLSLRGKINFFWLACIIACVATVDVSRPLPLLGIHPPPFTREALLLLLCLISWFTTPKNRELRQANNFSFGAILEVAALFIGIFICMQSPVEFLKAKGAELGLTTPSSFFWATGSLSSFLDNAPTYVVFFNTAAALTGSMAASGATEGLSLVQVHGGAILETFLLAISLGSVFMGANTYIGNGPNFMVKAIAEQTGVKMPSFFGFMVYSVAVLVPLFVVVMVLFLL